MAERLLRAAPGLPRLYARVVLDTLPLGRLTRAADPESARDSEGMAGLTVRLADVAVNPDRLAAYREVCGFAHLGEETLPATYPHVLAFGLHLIVMSDAGFPFPALGAVHIANRIIQRRRIGASEHMHLTVSAEDLRPHPRGRRITLVTEAEISGDAVWRAETVLLHRETAGGQVPDSVPPTVPPTMPVDGAPGRPSLTATAPPGPTSWRLPSDLGRRYARVSGDVNPIHLYDATAKAFGFPRHIAHGMWTKAACLAALSNRLDEAFTVDVDFRRPITLPSTVQFGARDDGGALDFGVSAPAGASRTDSSQAPARPATHLVGRITRN